MLSILLPVIKPELKSQFLNKWSTWFVTESTVEDEKYPGKLKGKTLLRTFRVKIIRFLRPSFLSPENFRIWYTPYLFSVEWGTRHGTFAALGNKMYQGYDTESDTFKDSLILKSLFN